MEDSMNSKNTLDVPVRADKTIAWLTESRDQWKKKCLQAKTQLKRKTLALKRVRDGRSQLKHLLRSEQKQNRKHALTVKTQKDQISELKKKLSSKKMI